MRLKDHQVPRLIENAACMDLGAIRSSFRRATTAAVPKVDGRHLRDAIFQLEHRAEHRMVFRQIDNREFRWRQHFADLADPYVPRVAPPEIVDPQESALA